MIKNIMLKYYLAGAVIGALTLALIVAVIIVNGNPFDLKAKNLDQRRINDFIALKSAVDYSYNLNGELPSSLDQLNGIESKPATKDPESNQPYVYIKLSEKSYNLCTTFSSENTDDNPNTIYPVPAKDISTSSGVSSAIYPAPENQSYKHKKGYDCITFKVYKYNYPVEGGTATPLGK